MAGSTAAELILVWAEWCPHCVLSTPRAEALARRLGVPLRVLDIDRPEEERAADALVERYGDWDPNYLIPQVFLRYADGRVRHLLTGVPGSLDETRRAWDAVQIST